MTTGVDEPIFLDTNTLVYASEQRAPLHATALQVIQDLYGVGAEVWISCQVLREYLATLTRPQTWGNPQPVSVLIGEVRHFERRFRVAEDGPEVTDRLLNLLAQIPIGGKQVHDANIVATMQGHGIRRLLTHNAADFARFAGIITVAADGAYVKRVRLVGGPYALERPRSP